MRRRRREYQIRIAAAKMSTFKVDVLLKTLEELQKEKRLNEQTLSKEYSKRKKLESKSDSVLSTLTVTSEEDARSKEALRMEEQRVQDTQRQIHQHEEVNDGVRERIAQLNHQIKQAEEERRSNLESFEERMGQLIEAFHSGWENIEGPTMDNYEEQKLKLTKKNDSLQNKLKSMVEQVEEEQGEKTLAPDGVNSMPQATLDQVCKMFKVENSASKAELERSGQEVLLMELENDIAVLLEQKEMELEGRGEENYIREI